MILNCLIIIFRNTIISLNNWAAHLIIGFKIRFYGRNLYLLMIYMKAISAQACMHRGLMKRQSLCRFTLNNHRFA